MNEEVAQTVFTTRSDQEVVGDDTVIATCPDNIAALLSRARDMDESEWHQVAGVLRELGQQMAEGVGLALHHGDFKFTSNPETVREFGIMADHRDCAACLAGVDQAVAHLEAFPDTLFVVGQLYWAEP